MIFILLAILITLLIGYIILKPYFIKYHTTLLFTGELGAGKTLNAVKTAVKQYRKILFTIKFKNKMIDIKNKIREKHNIRANKRIEKGKKHFISFWKKEEKHEQPRLISNIPIRYKGGKNPRWSNVLEKEMLTLEKDKSGFIKKIPEYSIVVIDELPQLIDQFNWDLKVVQENVNELITFFRQYINGLLIITAQAESQVVKQIRDKMAQFYWLSNFRRFLFFFYKVDVLQMLSGDVVQNINMSFAEDNTKTTYGIFKKGLYDSRCYSERYTKLPETPMKRWCKYKTNTIIRFDNYKSPLDNK